MRAECGRADLLRALHAAPDVPAAVLAAALGWDGAEPAVVEPLPTAAPARSVGPAAGPAGPPVQYLARPAPRYWRVVACEPLVPEAGTDPAPGAGTDADWPDVPTDPPLPPDPRMPPLLNAGQWQNLWDRLPPSPRRGRAIDLAGCLRRLTRAEPLRDPPRRPRRGFNRALTLLLDRPGALRPAWDDLRLARRTLADLFGDELQAFALPAGPDGPWLDLQPPRPPPRAPARSHRVSGLKPRLAPADSAWPSAPASPLPAAPTQQAADVARDREPGPAAIPPGALVVLIGAFGALETAVPTPAWRRLFTRLRAAGHPLCLVPVCPLRATGLPTAPLDPTPGSDRHRADRADTALADLLAALSQTWLPTPARLRRLRRAIPDADLHTELRAYNHPHVAHDALHLWLTTDRTTPCTCG